MSFAHRAFLLLLSLPSFASGQVSLAIDEQSNLGAIPPTLFGVNTPWENLGHQIVTGGELVSDRSFQDFGLATSPWQTLVGSGTVTTHAEGDPSPAGGNAIPGSLRIVGAGPTAHSGVAQLLLGPSQAGATYILHCSTYAEDSTPPALFATLANASSFAVVSGPHYAATQTGAWTRHQIELTATSNAAEVRLLIGCVGNGTLRIDEIRLSERPNARPLAEPQLPAKIAATGFRLARWPGGILVETLDWKSTLGTTLERTEQPAYGKRQTPAFGLREFLEFCESNSLDPVIQVNVLAPPADAADLADYCLGSAATPMGALRASHGHAAPYANVRFELGNEPSTTHGTGASAGAGYAALAQSVALAMKARQPSIQLSGALETSFQLADWLAADPLLANWNAGAFTLAPHVGSFHGHYYSYFAWDDAEPARFRRQMAAGHVLRQTRNLFNLPNHPLWLTEYHVVLENGSSIDLLSLKNAASGLVVGDILLEMLKGGFEGAAVFNLAESVGFGLLRQPGSWTSRPAGLAFQLLAPFAGETRLSTSLVSTQTVSLGSGKGNIPTGTTYSAISAIAARRPDGRLRLALLNRSYDQTISLALPPAASGPASLTWLRPSLLTDHNESSPATVALETETRTLVANQSLSLPPHSLVRIDFTAGSPNSSSSSSSSSGGAPAGGGGGALAPWLLASLALLALLRCLRSMSIR